MLLFSYCYIVYVVYCCCSIVYLLLPSAMFIGKVVKRISINRYYLLMRIVLFSERKSLLVFIKEIFVYIENIDVAQKAGA